MVLWDNGDKRLIILIIKSKGGIFMNSTLLWELLNFVILIGIVIFGVKIFKLISKMSKTSKKIDEMEKDLNEIKDKINNKN